MMLAMNIFLAVPALAENYQEYGLYDSDGNYKGMFYSIEEINDFLEETMTADALYIKCDGVNIAIFNNTAESTLTFEKK